MNVSHYADPYNVNFTNLWYFKKSDTITTVKRQFMNNALLSIDEREYLINGPKIELVYAVSNNFEGTDKVSIFPPGNVFLKIPLKGEKTTSWDYKNERGETIGCKAIKTYTDVKGQIIETLEVTKIIMTKNNKPTSYKWIEYYVWGNWIL